MKSSIHKTQDTGFDVIGWRGLVRVEPPELGIIGRVGGPAALDFCGTRASLAVMIGPKIILYEEINSAVTIGPAWAI